MTTQDKPAAFQTLLMPATGKKIAKADSFSMVEADYASPYLQQSSSEAKSAPSSPSSPPLIRESANAATAMQLPIPAEPSEPVPEKGGKDGERSDLNAHTGSNSDPITPPLPALPPSSAALHVTNLEFIAAVMHELPVGAHAAICSKYGDPTTGGWIAKSANQVARNLSETNNNYLNCSSFNLADDGLLHARKDNFAAYHLLMLDDINTKIPLDRFGNFEFSYVLETSPNNYQCGIILAKSIADGVEANRLLDAVIAAGLCDAGANGAQGRWARLPKGINGKVKHANAAGEPFQCRLVKWNPDLVYTQQEIVDGLKLELAPVVAHKWQAASTMKTLDYDHDDADDVFTPKSSENPVIAELKSRGLYKTPLGSGKHDVTCPWVHEHTDAIDTGAAYFEPDDIYPIGGFRCQHSHGDAYKTKNFLELLGIQKSKAKHKAVIRVVEGELHHIVNTAEKELAKTGRYYQSGDLIVTVATNPETGDPSIVPVNGPALTKVLSQCAAWEKFNAKLSGFVPSDPPARHITILNDSQSYTHLPQLNGVARQPYFRENDGVLVTEAGYDKLSQRFGVFDARKFVTSEPTIEAAHAELTLLNGLLSEFSYDSKIDKSAALSAIFTAVTRASYAYAPAFHTKASTIGSGKSYQNELIGAFAKPGFTQKVSYPTTSEEATKAILSLLLPAPAVIEFDDMATDWIPHGIINRMLTAESITDRILGVSKTATVSTRTLFLSSGNNVGPIRDLLRRVITINIDHRCATPATKSYNGSPVEAVRKDRGRYVAAVLTIILAWKAAGSPRADVENIATYGGAWADYCRHPLIWLGLTDPATALLEQVKHDPDADALLALLTEWHALFGSTATTVRKVISHTFDLAGDSRLRDVICEFHVEERGSINPSKFGWILKKNMNRIVGEYTLRQGKADGRIAWIVVKI